MEDKETIDKSTSSSRKRNLDAEEDDDQPEKEIPLRDCSRLYCSPITLKCAFANCVPCAYKIGNFDVSMDAHFRKKVPNQRPEQCRRALSHSCPDSTIGFQPGMTVLTVGDGDMSFSLALTRLLKRRLDTQRTTLIATSYEKKDTLLQCYKDCNPSFDSNWQELEQLGAKLYYEVDATRLEETLPLPKKLKFHRIIWNFPCTAIANGQDGQNDAMEHNKDLVRKFVKRARKLLMPSGEIHICHKTKPPYNQWRLEHVALEHVKDGSLHYVGKVILDRYLLPPYTPRKALDRKSFPCHDACFYIFATNSNSSVANGEDFLPTIGHNSEEDFSYVPTLPITPRIILNIRRNLLLHAESKIADQKRKKKIRQNKRL